MVIRGGENVYCVEIETVLYEHPAVSEAAVIGIPHLVLGEEVAAVVKRVPGAEVTEDQLKDHVSQRLAAFKVPVRIEVTDEPLPSRLDLVRARPRARPPDPSPGRGHDHQRRAAAAVHALVAGPRPRGDRDRTGSAGGGQGRLMTALQQPEVTTTSRVMVVWCPDWPVVAAATQLGLDPQLPLAVVERGEVYACSAAARVEGVRRGMRRRTRPPAAPS